MSKLGELLGNFLFPQAFTCDICGIETFESNLCPACSETVVFNNESVCPVCGRKTKFPIICLECKGNAPVFKLSDEQKTASFSYGTGAYYQDELLYEKCASIYKSADETVLEEADSETVYMEAEKILSAKLSQIGMTEIDIYKIIQYQYESITFYEIEFTPSYGGMGVIHEVGSIASGEIFPSGKAWICEESIVTLSLNACLGKAETQEKCKTVLSWSQIEKILETHLNSGKINGSKKAVLTEVEFLYASIYKEDENKLELVFAVR